MKKHILLILILAFTLAGKAHAGCSPSVTTPITFTSVNPLTTGTYNTTTTLAITCSGLSLENTFCFTIGAGTGGTNSSNQRLLAGSGSYTIPFQFYEDSGYTTPWPIGTPVHLSAILLLDGTVDVTIYLRLYINQTTLPPGTYSSTFSGSGALLNYGLLLTFTSCSLLSGSASTSFTVQTTLLKSCVLSAISPVAFGNVTVTSLMGNVTATGGLSVQCTDTTPYTVGLDNGQGSGVTGPAARKMTGPGGATLTYGLYQDSAHSLVWGNTTGTGGNTQGGTGSGNVTAYTVYGLMPPQTTPTAGSYSDTVGITVTY
jgi:spore coat protein U-like protein